MRDRASKIANQKQIRVSQSSYGIRPVSRGPLAISQQNSNVSGRRPSATNRMNNTSNLENSVKGMRM